MDFEQFNQNLDAMSDNELRVFYNRIVLIKRYKPWFMALEPFPLLTHVLQGFIFFRARCWAAFNCMERA